MANDPEFASRKEQFFKDLKYILRMYRMRVVSFIEPEEINGVVTKIKSSIYFIDDSAAYIKKEKSVD